MSLKLPETKPLLFEIGLEELPTKAVLALSEQLKELILIELKQAKLSHKDVHSFGTPRRLAILIEDLITKQADYVIEKKGPAVASAFDALGNPTKALEGFAHSQQASLTDLQKKEFNGNEFIVYQTIQPGKNTEELISEIFTSAMKKLTIVKPMRWGDSSTEFVRPIHWICLLYGDADSVNPSNENRLTHTIFSVTCCNKTYGHRYHAPSAIEIKRPFDYTTQLEQAYVIADFQKRKNKIHAQLNRLAKEQNATVIITEDLLEEVTSLVEWPEALLVDFDPAFLTVPKEALISAMQTHQKAFHLIDAAGRLIAKFITIANIISRDPARVIAGNDWVMRARLKDAAFFYEADCRISLEARLEKLKHIIFQKQLGTLYERCDRIAKLSAYLADKLQLNKEIAMQTGRLAKTDLVSHMVLEFPELQGTMGYYYALNDGLDKTLAIGIRDHYQPRFADDKLPETEYGCLVSIADRIDKLVGIFGIQQAPSGIKDPYALRRAAIGLLNIIIEKKISLDLRDAIEAASKLYGEKLLNTTIKMDVLDFIMERLKHWYQGKNSKLEFFNAVYEKQLVDLSDFDHRVKAVEAFSKLAEAESLAKANKRVNNILAKENIEQNGFVVNERLFELDAEKNLAKNLNEKIISIKPLLTQKNYTAVLQNLADLQQPVDRFFDEVMVMADDPIIKNNRISLLFALRNLFLEVADISKL